MITISQIPLEWKYRLLKNLNMQYLYPKLLNVHEILKFAEDTHPILSKLGYHQVTAKFLFINLIELELLAKPPKAFKIEPFLEAIIKSYQDADALEFDFINNRDYLTKLFNRLLYADNIRKHPNSQKIYRAIIEKAKQTDFANFADIMKFIDSLNIANGVLDNKRLLNGTLNKVKNQGFSTFFHDYSDNEIVALNQQLNEMYKLTDKKDWPTVTEALSKLIDNPKIKNFNGTAKLTDKNTVDFMLDFIDDLGEVKLKEGNKEPDLALDTGDLIILGHVIAHEAEKVNKTPSVTTQSIFKSDKQGDTPVAPVEEKKKENSNNMSYFD
ncbi:MAG: hypothetical protein ACD_46C00187G0002 [uncultured bacterium]|nr:MAG: hypothetical protein ACD_46C00187G0002 [uncultured bacterium]